MIKFLVAPIIAIVMLVGFGQPTSVEAKVSYGPCVDTYFYYWRVSNGELGIDWLARKIWNSCDDEGDWNE